MDSGFQGTDEEYFHATRYRREKKFYSDGFLVFITESQLNDKSARYWNIYLEKDGKEIMTMVRYGSTSFKIIRQIKIFKGAFK